MMTWAEVSIRLFHLESANRDDHQIAQITLPSGTNNQTSETVDNTYNTRTGLQTKAVSSVHGVIVDDTTWNNAGQLRTRLYGTNGANGVVDLRYSASSLWMTENRGGSTGSTGGWQKLQYAYDNNGNITRIRDFRNSNQRQCFTYDTLDRLKTAYTDNTNSCNGHTATGQGNYNDTYNYSSGGNLTSKTGSGNSSSTNGTYSYSDPDLAHAVTSTSNGSTYAYDDNGNMTTRNPNGQSAQTLAWDPDQQLDSVQITGGTTTSFLYDADGARVRRQTGSTTTFYSGGSEYQRVGSSGAFTHYYNVGGDTVAYNNNGTLTFMWADYVNSTSLTRTGTTNKIQRYTPWGETRTNGNLTTDHHYTGQIADQETRLAFYNARYYDPALGRFVSPDTIVPSAGNGQDYNRYTYVRNNPINFNDPTGHCTSGQAHLIQCYGFTTASGASWTMTVSGPADIFSWTTETITVSEAQMRIRAGRIQSQGFQDGFGAGGTYEEVGYNCYLGNAVSCGELTLNTYGGGDGGGYLYEAGRDNGRAAQQEILLSVAGSVTGRLIGAVRRVPSAARHLCSFSGETEVLMADGTTKPISEVEVGDWVLAEDPETGERGVREVTHLWVHQDTIIDLEIGGHDVATTEDHPFWNATDSEWQRAGALDPGDLVLTAGGATLTVEGMDWDSARTTTAYNLTVDEIHTYFVVVAAEEVLVHNVCDWTTGSRLRAAGPGDEFGLPSRGRIRYVPAENYNPANPLPRGPQNGYLDRFGNEWVVGPSRTSGQPFEWDVQLSRTGQNQIGWLSTDGSHVNVSPLGEVTH